MQITLFCFIKLRYFGLLEIVSQLQSSLKLVFIVYFFIFLFYCCVPIFTVKKKKKISKPFKMPDNLIFYTDGDWYVAIYVGGCIIGFFWLSPYVYPGLRKKKEPSREDLSDKKPSDKVPSDKPEKSASS